MLSVTTLKPCDAISSAPLLEIDHMTRKEFAEATQEVVAVGLWTGLFVFTFMVGIVVCEGIVRF
jgi:hypothetical protein